MASSLSAFRRPETYAQDRCRIALAGFGTVGSSVARLLQSRPESPLQLTHIFNRDVTRKTVGWIDSSVRWTESLDDVVGSNADIVVELIGGVDSAHQLVRRALESGKSVVTANKQLIAQFGPQLQKTAADNGCDLRFGGCVAGGIPLLSALQEGLAGDQLFRIQGILNGTCNYILTRMEAAGISFANALQEAQTSGFAEADPSEDIDGVDAAAKLTIVARLAFQIEVLPRQVVCRTIRNLNEFDFAYAHELGCTIRQISTASINGGHIWLTVGPALVPRDSPLAKVFGIQNLIVTTGTFGGDTFFGGNGAGGDPTAVAVVSDVLQAARGRSKHAVISDDRIVRPCKIGYQPDSPHYLRFVVKDRPGILAVLTEALAKRGVNVDAVLQKPDYRKSALPFVITVEACPESKVQAAMEKIASMDFLVEPPMIMPVLR